MKNPLLKSYCIVLDQTLIRDVDELAVKMGYSRSQVVAGAIRLLLADIEETRRKQVCQTSEQS